MWFALSLLTALICPLLQGLGLYYATRYFLTNEAFCAKHGVSPGIAGKTVVVSGFGNVGFYAAKFFEQHGARVVGVIEYNGATGSLASASALREATRRCFVFCSLPPGCRRCVQL